MMIIVRIILAVMIFSLGLAVAGTLMVILPIAFVTLPIVFLLVFLGA